MNPALRFWIIPAIFMLVVISSGIVHGFKTFRWVEKPSLDEYVNRLKKIPTSFGDWSSEVKASGEDLFRSNLEVITDPATGATELRSRDNWKAHGIEDYIIRDYRNKRTTEAYRILLVCGRPGPIASHSPEVCYRGSGYTQVGEQAKYDCIIDDQSSPYYSRRFVLNLLKLRPPATRVDGRELQIRWGMMAPDAQIDTPSNPRFTYASKPALYKLYVNHEMLTLSSTDRPSGSKSELPAPSSSGAKTVDPTNFLKQFLPLMESALKDPPPTK